MHSRRTLICAAMPFGYGPAAKLLTLAPHLRRSWRLVFVGRGTAAELVGRQRDHFDLVVDSNAPGAPIEALIAKADGVLSIMDREVALSSRSLDKPLYVVDSLLWMRDDIPRELRHARVYWSQRFGDEEPPADSPPLEMVGPILAPPVASPRQRGLLIHLGGCEQPEGPSPILEPYFDFLIGGLAASGICHRYAESTLLVGQTHAKSLQERLTAAGCSIQVRSTAYDEALQRLRQAEVVLTAPGLTATLEAFRGRRPTFFLPPQNYSQWCILQRLRRRELAPLAFHWQDLRSQPDLSERLPEGERTPLMQQAIRKGATDGLARELFRTSLDRITARAWDDLAHRQSGFLDSLGECGTTQIATRLSEIARGATGPAPRVPQTVASRISVESPGVFPGSQEWERLD